MRLLKLPTLLKYYFKPNGIIIFGFSAPFWTTNTVFYSKKRDVIYISNSKGVQLIDTDDYVFEQVKVKMVPSKDAPPKETPHTQDAPQSQNRPQTNGHEEAAKAEATFSI